MSRARRDRSEPAKGEEHKRRLWRRCNWKSQGMDPDEAEAAYEAADACQVCGSTKRMAVDHCHSIGWVRGVLCNKCNVALGLSDDDPMRLIELARYLGLEF